MPTLKGSDVESLAKLLSTALNEHTLEMIVYSTTGDRLYRDYVAKGKPLRITIYELLIVLDEQGTTAIFLTGVHKEFERRADVRAEIERLFPEICDLASREEIALTVQKAGQSEPPAPDTPSNAFAPGLQRNVRPHLKKLDVRVWGDRLAQIERRVCRIERAANPLGTGFLVGPDVVLTNWHVVESSIQSGKFDELSCRFDYLRLSNGKAQPGVAVSLRKDGRLDSSPYSPAEKTKKPDDPAPKPDELDYALLRLAEPVGNSRAWIELPTSALPQQPGAPLLIVQHPFGEPMKLALDTEAVVGPNPSHTRIRYRTNTDPGSSGSPCFTMDWDIVALHHYGDPAWQQPLFNQGVPIELIGLRIREKGLGAVLGGAA